MKITHAKLAQVAQVTTRTIINWEKEKPELIRLLKKGIIADNNAQEFFKLFEPKGFWNMGDFYLDFYFKFLNYYRKIITEGHDKKSTWQNNIDIESIAFMYLIEHNQKEMFDEKLIGNQDLVVSKFKQETFKKPLFHVNSELSKYILMNTLDGFGLLVYDTLLKNRSKLEDAIRISLTYVYYMFSDIKYNEITEKVQETIENKLGLCKAEKDYEKIYKNYLKHKKQIFSENTIKDK
jgi:hypothetical protein